jgi:hypothetical protein
MDLCISTGLALIPPPDSLRVRRCDADTTELVHVYIPGFYMIWLLHVSRKCPSPGKRRKDQAL